MLGIITPSESVQPNRRYWLDPDGVGYMVEDHLQAAQYAKAESDEYDKRGPWSYEDMWHNGWVRVHTEPLIIWADNGMRREPNYFQKRWLKIAAVYIGNSGGSAIILPKLIGPGKGKALPTREFLEQFFNDEAS